ncbi:MAG TPA: MBL fold metallo-hydrolase [Actinomycetota bacterium]|nr:MBL fold metallo-hydrolase [Actinomycetota bacterium]
MIFRQFLHEQRSCASYLIGCASKGVGAVVDPQGDPSQYVAVAERHGLHITDVMDTHVHADHPSGARQLAERTGATLRMGAGAPVEFDFQPLAEGAVIEVGNRHIRVIHTPGHTPEHVTLLVDDWFVLTGDTLFVGDVGRVDLALEEVDTDELRSRARELHASLQKLLELPPETEVYPGHYAGSTCGRGMDGKTISTIGRERRTNRALALELEDFVDFQLSSPPPLPADFERIKRANLSSDRDGSSDLSDPEVGGGAGEVD